MSNDHKIDERYQQESWDKMSALLDAEMPVKEERKERALFFWIPILGLLLGSLGLWYIFNLDKSVHENKHAIEPVRVPMAGQEVSKVIASENIVEIETADNTSSVQENLEDKTKIKIKTVAERVNNQRRMPESGNFVSRSRASIEKSEIQHFNAKELSKDAYKLNAEVMIATSLQNHENAQEKKSSTVTSGDKKLSVESLGLTFLTLDALTRIAPKLQLEPFLEKTEMITPVEPQRKRSFDIAVSGIADIGTDFIGIQGAVNFRQSLSEKWFLTAGLGMTQWLNKSVLTNDSDLSPLAEVYFDSEIGPISTTRMLDYNAALGLSYVCNNWKFNGGARYRHFFNHKWEYDEMFMDNNSGIGTASGDESFKNELQNRVSQLSSNFLNPYLGFDYMIKNKLGLGFEIEYSRKQIDINGSEDKPIYLSASARYRF